MLSCGFEKPHYYSLGCTWQIRGYFFPIQLCQGSSVFIFLFDISDSYYCAASNPESKWMHRGMTGPSSRTPHGLPQLCCTAWGLLEWSCREQQPRHSLMGQWGKHSWEGGKAEVRKEGEGEDRWEKRAEKARALLLIRTNGKTLVNTRLVPLPLRYCLPTRVVLIKMHTNTNNRRIGVSQNERHQYNQMESTSYHIQKSVSENELIARGKILKYYRRKYISDSGLEKDLLKYKNVNHKRKKLEFDYIKLKNFYSLKNHLWTKQKHNHKLRGNICHVCNWTWINV